MRQYAFLPKVVKHLFPLLIEKNYIFIFFTIQIKYKGHDIKSIFISFPPSINSQTHYK